MKIFKITGELIVEIPGANLYGADLRKADLREADLREADLREAYLREAYLREADLREADLRGADLRKADLRKADLRKADLRGANLRGANLRGAYLRKADLRGADLFEADLYEADLKKVVSERTIVPEGDIIGWKKLEGGIICKLKIPTEAARVGGFVGRKCRAEFAIVLEGSGKSFRGGDYRVGETVRPDKFDPDPCVECSGGIHFFITRAEAEDYDY